MSLPPTPLLVFGSVTVVKWGAMQSTRLLPFLPSFLSTTHADSHGLKAEEGGEVGLSGGESSRLGSFLLANRGLIPSLPSRPTPPRPLLRDPLWRALPLHHSFADQEETHYLFAHLIRAPNVSSQEALAKLGSVFIQRGKISFGLMPLLTLSLLRELGDGDLLLA